jgi:M6 family metalloprotease-like protein
MTYPITRLFHEMAARPAWCRWTLYAVLASGITWCATAAEEPDLREYATVETALRAKDGAGAQPAGPCPTQSGYLGVELRVDDRGRIQAGQIAEDSPAQRCGLRPGDVLLRFNETAPASLREARDWLSSSAPGAPILLTVDRAGAQIQLKAQLDAASRPLHLAEKPAFLGTTVTSLDDGEGLRISEVAKNSPAAGAGLKPGDILLTADGQALLASSSLNDTLSAHEAGDLLPLTYLRGKEQRKATVRLTEAAGPEDAAGKTGRKLWKQPLFRLAVIGVEFANTQHNPAILSGDWERFFFSTNACAGATNATGQLQFGSVNDYYQEVSCGNFHFEGRFFDWVRLSKPRADYSQGTANKRTRNEFFKELLDKLLEREGTNVLARFDGLALIYAGERLATANRGTLFWPHRATASYNGRSLPYVICPEGGKRMANISVFCHEFGHVLGLPDLYARPENPGSEGVGAWCAMSNQAGNGRPQHLSAWCKIQLGWLNPTVLDPSVQQKLVLSPVEGSPSQCFKIPVRPDGAEYFLLENRQQRGFDKSLPAFGLLIWHVIGNRLFLEESHGIEGPAGPRVALSSIPYPSHANTAFTSATTPSSRPQLSGGTAISLTQIRQLPDGRITFEIGREYN